ncbi:potassium transporter 4-like [Cynara cardunculus var. scolymus]|uniref:potassium transporter 4-like n=1 Tax=Cynara cardunculus var. scolymus TaxID=59895 RepID=UPI000D62D3BF|nr:potassium transporter 4-like [Cynara cardunculus var. scolymus]
MEPQTGTSTSQLGMQFFFLLPRNLLLAYQSFGVVYGDLSTSPLYVYRSVFAVALQNHQNPEVIFGAFSLIFWALTLIPLLKYTCIVLSADDCGEGGTFALYSLLCRHAKFSLLPNQQAADEELSSYKYGSSGHPPSSSSLHRFLERHKKSRTTLLVVVLLGASMVIGDGVITPAISVLSAVSAFQVKGVGVALTHGQLVLLACVVLVGLFALQHFGTHRVAFVFAPVIILWLVSIFSIGLYNIIRWNPKIVHAFSPHYIIKFFSETRKEGWISLGGVLLSITGTEAMFADLGHFTASSIRLAFGFFVYPCLVIQYMGQAAYLSKNITSIPDSFYKSIPEPIFWPVFALANLAAVVGSQAIITATFSIVKQCHALGFFPRVKIVHTSKHMFGQIYIPEINWILMILTLLITVGFQDTTQVGNAYGLACMTVMFITTFLMGLVITFVWQKNVIYGMSFLLFFGFIEGVYLSAAIRKAPQGGWVSLLLACVFMFIMFVWHYGTRRKYKHDMHNKVQLKWLLNLGPSLGIVRVPGIGLIYSELATGIPSIFSHFVMNLPAFHNVLVFVCVKYVPVPFVSLDERYLIGRVCPRPYRMYRCIMRYGYKDIPKDDENFENQLTQSIAEFIQMEAVEPQSPNSEASSFDGRMAVISSRSIESRPALIISDHVDPTENMKSSRLKILRGWYDEEKAAEEMNPRRRVRFEVAPRNGDVDGGVRDELLALVEAKEAGVAYITGFSYIKARKASSLLKKFVIDVVYSFLRKNCRRPAVALHIPHISLIEVGMMYYV